VNSGVFVVSKSKKKDHPDTVTTSEKTENENSITPTVQRSHSASQNFIRRIPWSVCLPGANDGWGSHYDVDSIWNENCIRYSNGGAVPVHPSSNYWVNNLTLFFGHLRVWITSDRDTSKESIARGPENMIARYHSFVLIPEVDIFEGKAWLYFVQ
jgi:hypothetical protein